MSQSLSRALTLVFGVEGGYVNHPADRGGRTIYGIAEASNPGMWANGPPTRAAAEQFYVTLWVEAGCDYFDHLDLPAGAVAHFDAAVHHGVAGAVRLLQRAIGGLNDDGQFGRLTRERLAAISIIPRPACALLPNLLFTRLRFMSAIVANDSSQLVFLRGWFNRVINLYSELH